MTHPPEAGYLRHFQDCNKFDASKFLPFFIEGQQLGWLSPQTAELLQKNVGGFLRADGGIRLDGKYNSFESRSAVLAEAAAAVASHYNIRPWGEMYRVVKEWGARPLARIDRGVAHVFGVHTFGVSLIGYVRKEGGLNLWVGTRSWDSTAHSGKLDMLAGGGIAIGDASPMDTQTAEARAEAGLPEELTRQAIPAAPIHFCLERREGVRKETLFPFHLELPEDFIPKNRDGEIKGFELWTAERAAERVRTTDDFKYNVSLALIDFLKKHGILLNAEPSEIQAIQSYLAPESSRQIPSAPPVLRS